jgi:hypothetical protein
MWTGPFNEACFSAPRKYSNYQGANRTEDGILHPLSIAFGRARLSELQSSNHQYSVLVFPIASIENSQK